MLAPVNNLKLNNQYAMSFKGQYPNNSSFVLLPTDPNARKKYLDNNREVVSEGFADGNLPFSQLLARRIVSFWKLITQDPEVERDANALEKQIRDIVKNDNTLRNRLDDVA